MNFFGMGTTEILIVALIAFVLLGPKKMIDAARMAGKASRELRKTLDDLPSLDFDIDDEPKKAKDDAQPAPPTQVVTPAEPPAPVAANMDPGRPPRAPEATPPAAAPSPAVSQHPAPSTQHPDAPVPFQRPRPAPPPQSGADKEA
ncbi:MAG: twin-arginine translocase TatA/TatE family subunit [SAR202 cluster bacterium]|nr:twin-arginine translocase TatA/TatE family subunit [SAR202 cluster bacterium]